MKGNLARLLTHCFALKGRWHENMIKTGNEAMCKERLRLNASWRQIGVVSKAFFRNYKQTGGSQAYR